MNIAFFIYYYFFFFPTNLSRAIYLRSIWRKIFRLAQVSNRKSITDFVYLGGRPFARFYHVFLWVVCRKVCYLRVKYRIRNIGHFEVDLIGLELLNFKIVVKFRLKRGVIYSDAFEFILYDGHFCFYVNHFCFDIYLICFWLNFFFFLGSIRWVLFHFFYFIFL